MAFLMQSDDLLVELLQEFSLFEVLFPFGLCDALDELFLLEFQLIFDDIDLFVQLSNLPQPLIGLLRKQIEPVDVILEIRHNRL